MWESKIQNALENLRKLPAPRTRLFRDAPSTDLPRWDIFGRQQNKTRRHQASLNLTTFPLTIAVFWPVFVMFWEGSRNMCICLGICLPIYLT